MGGVGERVGGSWKVARRSRYSLLLGGWWVSKLSISLSSASITTSSKTSPFSLQFSPLIQPLWLLSIRPM